MVKLRGEQWGLQAKSHAGCIVGCIVHVLPASFHSAISATAALVRGMKTHPHTCSALLCISLCRTDQEGGCINRKNIHYCWQRR
jgi:hypothetical protein